MVGNLEESLWLKSRPKYKSKKRKWNFEYWDDRVKARLHKRGKQRFEQIDGLVNLPRYFHTILHHTSLKRVLEEKSYINRGKPPSTKWCNVGNDPHHLRPKPQKPHGEFQLFHLSHIGKLKNTEWVHI